MPAAPAVQSTRDYFHVMTKPIGPICNLDCKYCYYLEKEKLFPKNENFKMSDEVIEAYVRQYIEAQNAPEVNFAWQGGEPTLLGVNFFRKAVALQQKYAGGKRIANALQTNGTLLTDEWCHFFVENHFLIGLSVDGPERLHDAYRVDKRQQPTFARVMKGLELLKQHKVDFNTLTVVNRLNSREPEEVYRFLKETGSGFLQFIPLVERLAGAAEPDDLTYAHPPAPGTAPVAAPVTKWSVQPAQYGEFLVAIFDEWVRNDVGKVFVQIFDVSLGNWAGLGSSLCLFTEECGSALALEHNGDVYSCDHYVYPEYRLGNLLNRSLGELANTETQRQFGANKKSTLPRYCQECEVRFACHGECPKHRFMRTPAGEPGLNYLCAAYKRFFKHIDPYMQTMARLLAERRPPASIMEMLAQSERPGGTKG
jgi:uncharacterized protein